MSRGDSTSGAIKVFRLWDGVSEGVQEDVTVVWKHGVISDITSRAVPDVEDFGNAFLIPPVVNTHAHLEFSHLTEQLSPALPFTDWIGKTMAVRRENPDVGLSIQKGIDESSQAGTAVLGEIVTTSELVYPENESAICSILFRELIGLTPETIEEQLKIASDFVSTHREKRPVGLSPHAPYTVRPEFLERIVSFASENSLPLMMHLAETEAELEMMQSGTGELVEMLQRFGLWDPQMIPSGMTPLTYLEILAKAPLAILAHCNYLDEKEIRYLKKQPQMSVAYCPRTHHFFSHSKHLWEQMFDAGINVTLGTDGRGSNPDLNLWNEAKFLGQGSSSDQARKIISMATVNGWRAFGNPVSIETGRPARWSLVFPEKPNQPKFSNWCQLLEPNTFIKTFDHAGLWEPSWWKKQ